MIALSFRFPYHGEYSSYHRLIAHLDEMDRSVDASLPRCCYSRWVNPRGHLIRAWRRLKEREAWRIAIRDGHGSVHYLYPEHTWFSGKYLRKKGQNVIFSCHLPAEMLANGPALPPLQRFVSGLEEVDGIVVMSPDQIADYRRLAPQARVVFIPHGIDIHYFCPKSANNHESSREVKLLTVGNMMRDFDRLGETIRVAAERPLQVRFTVVASRVNLRKLQEHVGASAWKLVEPLYGVSDDCLRELYQSSHLLFLPLRVATANNALLEAMASGLPMFISDLPACKAYAGECAEYFSGDEGVEDLMDRIEVLIGDGERLSALGSASRLRAEKLLAWEVIAKRHAQFVMQVTNGTTEGVSHRTGEPAI